MSVHTPARCAGDPSSPTFCGTCPCAISVALILGLEEDNFSINGTRMFTLPRDNPVAWGNFIGACQSSYISAWEGSGASRQAVEQRARCSETPSDDNLKACQEVVEASPEYQQLQKEAKAKEADAGP